MAYTTIPITADTKDRLAEHPEKEGRDWDTFLRRELLDEDIDGEPHDPPIGQAAVDMDAMREIVREEVRKALQEVAR